MHSRAEYSIITIDNCCYFLRRRQYSFKRTRIPLRKNKEREVNTKIERESFKYGQWNRTRTEIIKTQTTQKPILRAKFRSTGHLCLKSLRFSSSAKCGSLEYYTSALCLLFQLPQGIYAHVIHNSEYLGQPSAPVPLKHAAATPFLGVHVHTEGTCILGYVSMIVQMVDLAPRLAVTSANSSMAESCPTSCNVVE